MYYTIDTHVHTPASDSSSDYEEILRAAKDRKLDGLVITDHGTTSGVPTARELARPLGIEIVQGIEINTGLLHVIGIDIKEEIPDKLPIEQTVRLIHEQGGLAVIAHPTNGRERFLSETIPLAREYPLGIECMIVDGGSQSVVKNINAFVFAEAFGLTKIGCSDAHNDQTIGLAVSQCYGSSFKDFREAFLNKKMWVGSADSRRF